MLQEPKQICFYFILLLVFFSCSFSIDKPHIVGSKIPTFTGVTSSGLKIDSTYFKGKVTLITFFHVGCAPCLYEINWLKRLKQQPGFQVLYIVSHTAWEMKQFNSDIPNSYSKIRLASKAGKIEFAILPQCAEPTSSEKPLIEPDCNTIGQKFRATGFPSTYLIGKKGIIRQAWFGFPMDSAGAKQKIVDWQREVDQF